LCAGWSPATGSLLDELAEETARPAVVEQVAPFAVVFGVKNLADGSDGEFTVEVHPEWAPIGAARFSSLVDSGFFRENRFHRVVPRLLAQFGLNTNPDATIQDQDIPGSPISDRLLYQRFNEDEVRAENIRGRLAFAPGGKDSRTTQIVLSLRDNRMLDEQGIPPFAEVIDGIEVLDKLFGGYGKGGSYGPSADEEMIVEQGNSYLEQNFPKLSYIGTVRRETIED
jgi:cyclophilin family peptidyl-prolyl cis-trans isomerase